MLDLLPTGHVFNGELAVLADAGRPLFKEPLVGRRRPTYVAFDLLIADGIDLRLLPLRRRKAVLAQIGECAERRIALTNGVVGKAGRFTGPWSAPTWKASSPSILPTAATRSSIQR